MPLTIGLCTDKNSHRRILIEPYIRAFFRIAENTFNIVTKAQPTQLSGCGADRFAMLKTGFIRSLFGAVQQPVKITHITDFTTDGAIGKRR